MPTLDPGFKALTLNEFKGLYTTAKPEDTPAAYAITCTNAGFTSGGVGTRPGTVTGISLGGGTDIYHAEPLYFADTRYYLFLMQDHKLYYSTGGARTLLHSPTGSPTMFKLCTYGNLVYIFYSGGSGTFGTSGPFVWDVTKLPTVQIDLATIIPQQNILTRATAVLTSDTINVSAGDTVTVELDSFATFANVSFVYTFVDPFSVPQGLPGEVLVGVDAADSLANLKAAMNHDSSGEGVTYGLGTTDPYVLFTVLSVTATVLTLQAQQSGASQNGINVSTTAGDLSWGAATFTGGAKFDGADGTAGDCDAGYRGVRVLFRTRTGYVSSPSDARVCLVRSQSTLPMSGIPLYTGDGSHAAAECTSRVLIMTEAFGDPNSLDEMLDRDIWTNALQGTYYWALEINDNTTTTAIINISDSQLIEQTDATDNFQFTSPLPNFSFGRIYKERLCASGDINNTTLLYVSQVGSPQTFRADTGFIDVNHDDQITLVCSYVTRDFLYAVKGLGIWVTTDNGNDPSTWQLLVHSAEVGTASVCGVSQLSDEDFVVISDFRGMYLDTGSPPEKMSKNIQPTWDTLSIAYLATSEIHIDTVNRRVLCLVPTSAATQPNKIFACDYFDGWANAKWSIWTPPAGVNWRSIIMDTAGYKCFMAVNNSVVQQFDNTATTDRGTAIAFEYITGILEPRPFGLQQWGFLDWYGVGGGTLTLKFYGPTQTLLDTPMSLTLSASPDQDVYRRLNFRTERCFLGMSQTTASDYCRISRITAYAKPDGMRGA